MDKVHDSVVWNDITKIYELDCKLAHECNDITAQIQHLIQSLRQPHLKLLAQFGLESVFLDCRRFSDQPTTLPLKSNEKLCMYGGKIFGITQSVTREMGNDISHLLLMRRRLKQLLPVVMAAAESEQPEYII